MLTKQSWFSLGGLSVVCETLAIYCIACIYIVNYRYLKLVDAPGQSEVVLGFGPMKITLYTKAPRLTGVLSRVLM